jgi:Pyruvate/2-oxoacid:ferredoxin oxidoreductase gamma subunit
VPLTEICNEAYTDPRQRQLFKNIIYVGALSALLDIEATVVEKLFAEQYRARKRCSTPTSSACTWAAMCARQPALGRSA